ncbi:MAG: PAS domain-containing sensor histidine kinase, partial [Magnetococcales bacterium]|nr:PAS domain-containing sensor histidine kinase [Magnetococcales bacterium]
IVGYRVADLFGQELFEQRLRPMLDQCLAGHPVNYEAWFDFPAHGRRFMNVSYHPYRDNFGTIAGVVVVSRDMTELAMVSQALQENEQRFRTLFDAMPAGVAVYRPTVDSKDFIFIDFNKAAEASTNTPGTMVVGRLVTEVFPGIVEMGLLSVLQRVDQTGRPEVHSVSPYQDEHLQQWFKNYVYKLPNGELVAIFEDWTERKQAEALIESMARFPNENPYPVLRVTPDGTLIFANAGAKPLLDAWACKVGDKLPDPQRRRFQEVIASGCHQIIEEALGRQYFSLNLVPFPAAGYANLYAMDITPLKLALAQLEEKNQIIENINRDLGRLVVEGVQEIRNRDLALIHQSRQAAMGEMINSIAHQWRQPLNALSLTLANIESLSCAPATAEEAPSADDVALRNKVAKAYDIIHQMSKTIDDFRRFFRPDKIPVPFNLSAIVWETTSLIENTFTHLGIKLDIRVEDPEVPIMGYPNELAQTLLILLSNAKDAIQESHAPSGHLAITVGRRARGHAGAGVATTGAGVVVVEDNGGGIPEEILDRIFDPYFTTKEGSHGTGIGLHIARTIVEQSMQGHLTATNTASGARFEIQLPLLDTAEGSGSGESSPPG